MWLIEWWEEDAMTGNLEHNSDVYDKWEDAIRILNECDEDVLCYETKITYITPDHDN